mmetsp:Transcript_89583/g.109626  ORF Transcript_89583/g.109626 Transcript_89583/m.109626 type:complete len:292 (+) Transcript_89583:48-923(+)
MGDSELIVPIDQALWPKGVARSLSGVLRNLGDKHGNLVIVAQPTKGHIMVKGPAEKIQEAKPGLRTIIEEHFPDADCPQELLDNPVQVPSAEPAAASVFTPAPPPVPTQPPVPKVPAPSIRPTTKEQEDAEKVVIEGPPCKGRKIRPASHRASSDLLWECIRNSSCFIRSGGPVKKRRFSAEPGNLLGLHSLQFSNLANDKALDVRPKKVGKKESIELVQSTAKTTLRHRPGSLLVSSGLNKCKRKGLRRLDREILGMSYRPALHKLARLKYLKIRSSFKKPKPRTAQREK